MASFDISCGTCHFRHITKPSTVWCPECDDPLCDDCSEHHAVSKLTRQHATIPISEYKILPSFVLETSQFCSNHDEKFVLFCKTHNCPCCRTCVTEDHKLCQDIARIEDVVHNIKSSNAISEIEKALNELGENLQRIRTDREENLIALSEATKRVEKEIQEIRLKINNHIDNMQSNLLKELYEVEEIEKKKIEEVIQTLDRTQKNVTEIKTNFSSIKNHASELQTYLGMKKIESVVVQNDQVIQSLLDRKCLNESIIKMIVNTSVTDFLSKTNTFGEISVEAKMPKVFVTRQKDQQAQIMMAPAVVPRNIDNITIKLQRSFDVGFRSIRGCCMMPDGRAVFTIYNSAIDHNVIGINNSAQIDFTTEIKSPFDIEFLPDNNGMAVTHGGYFTKCITIIDAKLGKIKRRIPIDSSNDGITFGNGNLYFCARGKGLRGISLDNNQSKSIFSVKSDSMSMYAYITYYENNLFFTDNETTTVTCCDIHGSTKWTFKNKTVLRHPAGVTVDNHGQVFVAGEESNNVVVISSDGKRYKVVLSDKDGPQNPRALYYQRLSDELVVVNKNGNAFVYKII